MRRCALLVVGGGSDEGTRCPTQGKTLAHAAVDANLHVLAAIVSPYPAPRRSQATSRHAASRPAVNVAAAGHEILQRLRINSTECTLGLPLAHGAYGSVRWATVDGVTCIAKSAKPGKIDADAFLAAEALINARLKTAAPEDAHLAPFLGAASVAGSPYLVWRACPGVHGTLEDFLEPRLRLTKLGRALGITPSHEHGSTFHAVLARTLLRELLSTLVVVHGCGVASRDIKPANLLVDDECHGLRLIDFGAASIASASDAGRPEQQGGGGPARGSSAEAGTAAYMPPEGAVMMPAVPGAYDIYSASLVVGGALCAVSVVAALLIGLTWDNAPGAEDDDTPDDAVVLGMLGALLTLVVGLQLVAARLQRTGDQLVLSSAGGGSHL